MPKVRRPTTVHARSWLSLFKQALRGCQHLACVMHCLTRRHFAAWQHNCRRQIVGHVVHIPNVSFMRPTIRLPLLTLQLRNEQRCDPVCPARYLDLYSKISTLTAKMDSLA